MPYTYSHDFCPLAGQCFLRLATQKGWRAEDGGEGRSIASAKTTAEKQEKQPSHTIRIVEWVSFFFDFLD
jgi:hypothetical protein